MSRAKELPSPTRREHARVLQWPAPLAAETIGSVTDAAPPPMLAAFRWRYSQPELFAATPVERRFYCFAFPRDVLSPQALTLTDCSSLYAVNAAAYVGFLEVFLAVAHGVWESSGMSAEVQLRLTAVPKESCLLRRRELDGCRSVSVPSLSDATSFSHYLLTLTVPWESSMAAPLDPHTVLENLLWRPKRPRGAEGEAATPPVTDLVAREARPKRPSDLTTLPTLTAAAWNALAHFVNGQDVAAPSATAARFEEVTARETVMMTMQRQGQDDVAAEFGAAFLFGHGLPFGGRLSFLLDFTQWCPPRHQGTVLPWILPDDTVFMREDRDLYRRHRSRLPPHVLHEVRRVAGAESSYELLLEQSASHVAPHDADRVFDEKELKHSPINEELAETRWRKQCQANVRRAETEAEAPTDAEPELAELRARHDARRRDERRAREASNEPTPPGPEQADRAEYARLEALVRRERRERLLAVVQRTNVRNFFETVWRPDATMGSSKKAQVMWFHEHLRAQPAGRGHFSFKRQHGLPNLSSFGSLMSSTMVELETLFSVTHYHRDIVAGLLSVLHTMTGDVFHANMMLAGRAELGKSFLLGTIRDLCIEKTVVFMSKMTPAALTGLDSSGPSGLQTNDIKVFIFDDIQPELIGIENHTSNHSRAAETNNSTLEAQIKTWLTTGVVNWKTVVIDDNGGRRAIEVYTQARSVILCASNARLSVVPAAVHSRFNVRDTEQQKRNDGVGVGQSTVRRLTEKQQAHKRWFTERFRRTQCFATIYGMMVEAGVFPKIDVEANVYLLQWLQECETGHDLKLNIKPRTQDMVKFYQMGAVLLDACDRFFDLALSPHCEKPWDPVDLIEWTRHLCGLQEHFTLSMGLMRDSFEDTSAQKAELIVYGWFHSRTTADHRAELVGYFGAAQLQPPPEAGALAAQRAQRESGLLAGLPGVVAVGAAPQVLTNVAVEFRESTERQHSEGQTGSVPFSYPVYAVPRARKSNPLNDVELQVRLLSRWICKDVNDLGVEDVTIERALTNLLDRTVAVDAFVFRHDRWLRFKKRLVVPALALDDRCFYLPVERAHQKVLGEAAAQAWALLIQSREQNQGLGLKQVLGLALSHEHARPRTLLYGACLPGEPYLFDTIEVRATPGVRRAHPTHNRPPPELAALLGDQAHEDVQREEVVEARPLQSDLDDHVVRRWLDETLAHPEWRDGQRVPSSFPVRLMLQLAALRYPNPPLAPYPLRRDTRAAGEAGLELYQRPASADEWLACVNDVPGATLPFARADLEELVHWQERVRLREAGPLEPDVWHRRGFADAFAQRLALYGDEQAFAVRANRTLGKRKAMMAD